MKVEMLKVVDPPVDRSYVIGRCANGGCQEAAFPGPYSYRRGNYSVCEAWATVHARDFRHPVIIERITEEDA